MGNAHASTYKDVNTKALSLSYSASGFKKTSQYFIVIDFYRPFSKQSDYSGFLELLLEYPVDQFIFAGNMKNGSNTAPTLVVKPRPSPIKVTNPTIGPATMVTEKGSAEKEKEESKFSAVLEKASRNLAKATKGKEEELGSGKGKEGGKKEKVTPACQGC